MPAAQASPTALTILLEETVSRQLTSMNTGVVVNHTDMAKLTLSELFAKQKGLGSWMLEDLSKSNPSQVMTPHGGPSGSHLSVAIRQRQATVRKLARLLEIPKPSSEASYVAIEAELIGGSDDLIVAAWRISQSAPQSKAQLAEQVLRAFPEDSRCTSRSLDDDTSLEAFGNELESLVSAEVSSLTAVREGLAAVQRTAHAQR